MQAVEELPSVKGSIERMKGDTYHTLNVDGAGDSLNAYMEVHIPHVMQTLQLLLHLWRWLRHNSLWQAMHLY